MLSAAHLASAVVLGLAKLPPTLNQVSSLAFQNANTMKYFAFLIGFVFLFGLNMRVPSCPRHRAAANSFDALVSTLYLGVSKLAQVQHAPIFANYVCLDVAYHIQGN